MQVYPLIIAMQRNQVIDAYRKLREVGDDYHPELQAICLHYMDDPIWEGLAETTAAHSTDPEIQKSMQTLLGRSAELVT